MSPYFATLNSTQTSRGLLCAKGSPHIRKAIPPHHMCPGLRVASCLFYLCKAVVLKLFFFLSEAVSHSWHLISSTHDGCCLWFPFSWSLFGECGIWRNNVYDFPDLLLEIPIVAVRTQSQCPTSAPTPQWQVGKCRWVVLNPYSLYSIDWVWSWISFTKNCGKVDWWRPKLYYPGRDTSLTWCLCRVHRGTPNSLLAPARVWPCSTACMAAWKSLDTIPAPILLPFIISNHFWRTKTPRQTNKHE